jgi:hypothetical protein
VVFFVCVHLIGVRVHLVDVGDIVDHNWFDLETKTCTKIINWKISIFFRKFYPTNQLLYQLHTSLSYRPPWSISYGSWISNYLCNQCLSLLKLQVRITDEYSNLIIYLWKESFNSNGQQFHQYQQNKHKFHLSYNKYYHIHIPFNKNDREKYG